MQQVHHPRRKFLQFGASGIIAALFGGLPKIGSARSAAGNEKGLIVRKDEGIHILTGRRKVPINIKISKVKDGINEVSFCVENMGSGRKMRVHKHLHNDELIFIHQGEGSLTLDETVYEVSTGDVVFVPRGVWHGLDNTGKEDLKMFFQYTPAGFEQYFIENGTTEGMPSKERTIEEYAATEKKYGMIYREASNK